MPLYNSNISSRLSTTSLYTLTSGENTIIVNSFCVITQVSSTQPTRLRLYTSQALMDADNSRLALEPLPVNSGLLLELIFTSTLLSLNLSPLVILQNTGINYYCNINDPATITVTYLSL